MIKNAIRVIIKEKYMNTSVNEKNKNPLLHRLFGEKMSGEPSGARNVRIWLGAVAAALGFLFGGAHLVFGAYPLGLALVSSLSTNVWLATLGSVLGALTLGKSGIIYGMISVLAVFLRIVISGTDKDGGGGKGEGRLFTERISLRVCCAVIGGFVSALYEILLSGFNLKSILFGASMILLSGALTFAFTGIYLYPITPYELVFGGKSVLLPETGETSKGKMLLFRASVLLIIALVSISLTRYRVFGVDTSFIYATVITLFAAKRFGWLTGAIVGFCSSFGISAIMSAAFALVGAAAGALFSFGAAWALIGGGATISLWASYTGGVSDFLSVFPEYLIGASVMLPILGYLEREKASPERESASRRATDMVGTMALAYRSRASCASDVLSDMRNSILPVIKDFSASDGFYEDYSLLLRLISEAVSESSRDIDMNEELTDKLEEALADIGLKESVVRAFGKSRPHFILAAEDRDGMMITSPELRRKISEAAGVRLTTPEFFRRDDMVLMECESAKKYKLRTANARLAGVGGEVSGDSIKVFEGVGSVGYCLISDGMGSGETAERTSRFATELLSAALGAGASVTTALHALNSLIQKGSEECCASVDLFAFDLIFGEASFIKSGAAPSYILRGESVFRIRSETMPLGVIREVDAERISVEISHGDTVIMLSDGIIPSGEDAAWLPELLRKSRELSRTELAKKIIEEALRFGAGADDMTVLVIKIEEIE